MPRVYLLIGLPGSGKSTWAKDKAKDQKTVIVNRDSFCFMIKGGKYIFDEKYESFIKCLAHDAIKIAISHGFDIIIDETNLTKEKRTELIENLPDRQDVDVVGVWFTENTKNLEYRMKDPRGYSEQKWCKVIESMKMSFEPPSESEFHGMIKLEKLNV